MACRGGGGWRRLARATAAVVVWTTLSTLRAGPAGAQEAKADHTLASWSEFDSLIRQRSSTVKEARGRSLEAEGFSRQRLGLLLPSLTTTLSGTQHLLLNEQNYLGLHIGTTPDPAFTWQAAATLRVPLFVLRGWYDYGTSRRGVNSARLLERDAKRRATALAIDQFLALILAEQLYRLGQSSLEMAKGVLRLTEKAEAQGFATRPDVLRAQQEVSAVEIRNVVLAEDEVRARSQLAAALGLTGHLALGSGMTPASALAHLRSACRLHPSAGVRADVAAARIGVEAASRDVTSARLALLPTIEAFSNVTYNSDASVYAPEKIQLSPNGLRTTWIAGGLVTFQLFDGGLRYGQHQEALGRLQVAEAKRRTAERDATQEVDVAAQVIVVAKERAEAAHSNQKLAVENARLTKLAFSNGQSSSFDLLESARRVWLAEVDVILAEVGLVGAEAGRILASLACEG